MLLPDLGRMAQAKRDYEDRVGSSIYCIDPFFCALVSETKLTTLVLTVCKSAGQPLPFCVLQVRRLSW
jgi:hypothetical protein